MYNNIVQSWLLSRRDYEIVCLPSPFISVVASFTVPIAVRAGVPVLSLKIAKRERGKSP
jgi:hypothetical protein